MRPVYSRGTTDDASAHFSLQLLQTPQPLPQPQDQHPLSSAESSIARGRSFQTGSVSERAFERPSFLLFIRSFTSIRWACHGPQCRQWKRQCKRAMQQSNAKENCRCDSRRRVEFAYISTSSTESSGQPAAIAHRGRWYAASDIDEAASVE